MTKEQIQTAIRDMYPDPQKMGRDLREPGMATDVAIFTTHLFERSRKLDNVLQFQKRPPASFPVGDFLLDWFSRMGESSKAKVRDILAAREAAESEKRKLEFAKLVRRIVQ